MKPGPLMLGEARLMGLFDRVQSGDSKTLSQLCVAQDAMMRKNDAQQRQSRRVNTLRVLAVGVGLLAGSIG
jgi:hypothetical protein